MRRIGDPGARRWTNPFKAAGALRVFAYLAIATFVVVVVVMMWRAVQRPNDVQSVLTFVFVPVLALAAAATPLFRALYGADVKRAALRAQAAAPPATVYPVRIPNVWVNGEPAQVRVAPQKAILVADDMGARITSLADVPQDLLVIRGADIEDIEVVEYVEADVAYEGLALWESGGRLAVILQVMEVSRLGVKFVTDAGLERVAANLQLQLGVK